MSRMTTVRNGVTSRSPGSRHSPISHSPFPTSEFKYTKKHVFFSSSIFIHCPGFHTTPSEVKGLPCTRIWLDTSF